MNISDFSFKQKIDFIGTIELNMTNLKFKFHDLPKDLLNITFVEPNLIQLIINNATASLDFYYIFRSNFYSSEGKATVQLTEISSTFSTKLISIPNEKEKTKKGPGIEIESLLINSAELKFIFENEGPLEQILMAVMASLKSSLIGLINGQFNQVYKPLVNSEIHKFLANITLSFPLPNTTMTLHYSMNEDPSIQNNGLELSFEGYLTDEKNPYDKKPYDIPHIGHSDADMAIHLSQYILDN